MLSNLRAELFDDKKIARSKTQVLTITAVAYNTQKLFTKQQVIETVRDAKIGISMFHFCGMLRVRLRQQPFHLSVIR